jgi:predicted transcriptional regulator
MPAPQPIPMTEAEQQDHTDAVILEALLDSDAQRPWSVDEVARLLNDPIDASDGLGRLVRAGLVHRHDGFVFASRAALRADEIAQ